MPLRDHLKHAIVSSPLHRPCLKISAIRQKSYYNHVAANPDRQLQTPSVFCLGNFKTGTVSLTGLFSQKLRGSHEPDAYLYSQTWLQFKHGQITESEWIAFLLKRARALNLEFEASGFLTIEAERLVQLFPDSRYILTIREPLSWVRSMLRHILKNRQNLGHHYWEAVFKDYFPSNDFQIEETSLQSLRLFPIRSMLDYWRASNRDAIESIPSDQLLILDTKKLSKSIEQLEKFMDWSPNTLDPEKSHLHSNDQSPDPLSLIPQEWLEAQCAPFLEQFKDWTRHSPAESLANGDDTPHD